MALAMTFVPRPPSANHPTPARAGGASSMAIVGRSAAGRRLALIILFSTTEPKSSQDATPRPKDTSARACRWTLCERDGADQAAGDGGQVVAGVHERLVGVAGDPLARQPAADGDRHRQEDDDQD